MSQSTPRRAGRSSPALFGALALLAVALGSGLAEWRMAAAGRVQTAAVSAFILDAEALLSALKDVETGQRGYVLVGDDSYLEPYEQGRREVATRLDALDAAAPQVTRGSSETLSLSELRQAIGAKLDWTARSVALRREQDRETAVRMIETRDGKRLMDASRQSIAQVQAVANRRLSRIAAATERRSFWLLAASLGSALAACLLLAVFARSRRRAERRATALLDKVMEHAPVGVGLLNRSLRLEHANPALAALGGATPGAATLPEDLRRQIEPELRRTLEQGQTRTDVEVTLRPDGPGTPARHLLMSFFPLLDPTGQQPRAQGVGLVATDVTARNRMGDELRRSEARLRLIVDSVPQLAWMTDATGEIQWYNRRWFDFTGGTMEEMRGSGWQSVHHPDHVEAATTRYREAVQAGEAWEDTFPLRGADGRYRWFLSRALPLREPPDAAFPDGRLIGWFGTNTDITEIREAEESLTLAKAAAEEANKAKSQFIANMSHELRTPLSAVIGYSEMLEEEAGDLEGGEAFREDLAKINANARHLLSLINDVLDLSKIEAGKMEVQPEDFDAGALLREVGETVGALVGKKKNELVLQVAPDLPPMHSDPVKIRQCLFNLLGNAAKFTEEGRITLSAERDADEPGWLIFRVADSGIGMTAEQLDRLFQRFTQADASTTRRFGGTGLGLAITKAFASMLGGTIDVTSEPGQGTCFTIRLPADVREIRAEPGDAMVQAGLAAMEAEETAPGQSGLVLVIDDDAATRDLLARFLRREGFAVRTASDGKAGLEMARELRPSAILLDVMMPRLDGWGVLSALKADPVLSQTPVIMVTVVQERGLAISLGAADYLNKPVEWDRLKRVLERYRSQPAPGVALVVERDSELRGELRTLLEREGWKAEEVDGPVAALARLASQPAPSLLLIEAQDGEEGEGFALIHELRHRPEWRNLPIIAMTAGTVDEAEFRNLRTAVHEVAPGEDGIPDELIQELRRIAAATPHGAPGPTRPTGPQGGTP